MTHFKTLFVTAAASLAFASPALADGHMESKTKAEVSVATEAKIQSMWDNMSAVDKAKHQAKMLTMSADEKAAYNLKLLHKTKLEAMTPEERALYKQKKMDMSADGKMSIKNKMHTLTDAEKAKHKAKMMNMTDAEKKAYKKSLMSAPKIMQKSTISSQGETIGQVGGLLQSSTTNAVQVNGQAQITTTVNCPAGTTAQPDMTCLVTGDYSPED